MWYRNTMEARSTACVTEKGGGRMVAAAAVAEGGVAP